MVEAGLLTRRRDERDNRLVRLWLTDAGRALREPVEAERRQLEEKITEDLTATERKHLMSALAKIHRSASGPLGGNPVEPMTRPSPNRAGPEAWPIRSGSEPAVGGPAPGRPPP